MRYGRQRFALVLLIAFATSWQWVLGAAQCATCGNTLGEVFYTVTDKVTGEVKMICYTCATWPNICSICGLPARNNPLELPDGRFLCSRDAKTEVLTEEDGVQTCKEMKEALDRLFSRWVDFPDTNVDVYIV